MIGSTNSMGRGITSDDTTTTRDKVLAGTTYLGADTNDETGIGTMPDRANWTGSVPMNGSVTIPDGAHKSSKVNGPSVTQLGAVSAALNCGQSKVVGAGYTSGINITANSLASQTPGNLAADKMLAGTYGVSNGVRVNGNIPDYGTTASYIANRRLANGRVEFAVARGAHPESWSFPEYMSYGDLRNLIGLTSSDMLRKDLRILDLTGSFQGYTDSPLVIFKDGIFSNISPTNLIKTYETPGANGTISFMLYNKKIEMVNQNSGGWQNIVVGRIGGMLNLTSYNYIYVNCALYDETYNASVNARIGVSKNAMLTGNAMDAFFEIAWNDHTTKERIIDVRNLSGDYYFYLFLPAMRKNYEKYPTISVYNLYLSQV